MVIFLNPQFRKEIDGRCRITALVDGILPSIVYRYRFGADNKVPEIGIAWGEWQEFVLTPDRGYNVILSIAIDKSGSMQDEDKLASEKSCLKDFIENSMDFNRGDQLALFSFNARVKKHCGFSIDKNLFNKAINSWYPYGGTDIYGVGVATSKAYYFGRYYTGKRAVILFSDGYDDVGVNPLTEQDVIDEALLRNVPIYTIGFYCVDKNEDEIKGEQVMKAFAQKTGGAGKAVATGVAGAACGAMGGAVGGAVAGPVGAVIGGGASAGYCAYVVEKHWPDGKSQAGNPYGGGAGCGSGSAGSGGGPTVVKTTATRIVRQ